VRPPRRCGCPQCGSNPDAESCGCNYPTTDEPWGHSCTIPPKGFCTDMSEMDGVVVDRDMSDALIHVRPKITRARTQPPPHPPAPTPAVCTIAHRHRVWSAAAA
jgi:hypothetical protein